MNYKYKFLTSIVNIGGIMFKYYIILFIQILLIIIINFVENFFIALFPLIILLIVTGIEAIKSKNYIDKYKDDTFKDYIKSLKFYKIVEVLIKVILSIYMLITIISFYSNLFDSHMLKKWMLSFMYLGVVLLTARSIYIIDIVNKKIREKISNN